MYGSSMTDPHAHVDAFGIAWRLGATLFFICGPRADLKEGL